MVCGEILVFYCCTDAYNKFSGLKQYTFTTSLFTCVKNPGIVQLSPLSQKLARLQPTCQLDYREGTQDPLPSSFRFLAEIQFLATAGLRPSIPRGTPFTGSFHQHGNVLAQGRRNHLSITSGRAKYLLEDFPLIKSDTPRIVSLLINSTFTDLRSFTHCQDPLLAAI